MNRISKGRNYGWGDNYRCGTRGVGPNPKKPMARYNPTIAPTDAVFYRGRLKAWRNDLFFGDFNDHHLHRLVLGSHQSRVIRQRIVYTAPSGIVDASVGPGRWLYLLTTNSIMRIVRR